MTIQTKFNLNDVVYFLVNNKVCSAPITSINIHISKFEKRRITYTVYHKDLTASLHENSVFSTKDELIKSL